MRWLDVEEQDDVDVLDPVRVERSRPVEDEEAEAFAAICELASPGPMLIDDVATGEGSPVATLPDGRRIICVCGMEVAPEQACCTIEANARLFCEARHMVLRLLRDRQHWRRREKELLERIASLETQLAEQGRPADPGRSGKGSSRPAVPR